MLTLRRLDVQGFGPYAEGAVLEFPQEPGVTVIYGDNMRGKTTLMNAIRYAFFGEIHGRGERTRGILAACNRDLTAQGKYDFTIALSVQHEGENYDLIRSATPKVETPQSDYDFTSTVALRRGGVVLGPAEREGLLRTMLPKEVARFFLFDGELLDQYAEVLISESETGRLISEAIEQILGVPVLRDARDHLDLLAAAASRAYAVEASKHQKTQALGNALQSANDIREAHINERDREKRKLEDLQAEREEIETELRRQEVYAAAVERLDKARKDRDAARQIQEIKADELQTAMADAWRTILEEPVSVARHKARKELRHAFEQLKMSLRAEATRSRHCGICEQDLTRDHGERLAATLPPDTTATLPSDFSGIAALSRASELDTFVSRDVRAEVRLISEAIRDARILEADAQGQITDATKTLDGRDPDELRRRRTSLVDLGSKIQVTMEAIDRHEEAISSQDAAIARFSKNLAKAGTPELAGFRQRERVLARARSVFDAAVERYKSELRARVEATSTQLFLAMTTEKNDYARLAINDNYGLTIVHKDGRAEDSRSAGAEQIVALALMGALQANAPLRGPIVMDTPFGRLDPQHTANVVKTLPSMAEQVILLVQEGEIDRATVRELLGGHLKKEYELEKETARRTRVVEVH